MVGQLNHGWTYICEALDLERFAMMPIGPLEKKVEALLGLGAHGARATASRCARARARARTVAQRRRRSSRWRACSSAA